MANFSKPNIFFIGGKGNVGADGFMRFPGSVQTHIGTQMMPILTVLTLRKLGYF